MVTDSLAPDAAPPLAVVVARQAALGRWLMGGILLLAWGLHWRTFGLQELGQDGYLSVDLGAGSLAAMLAYTARDVHPPLFFAALHGLFALSGEEYLVAKFLPIASSQLALVVLYRLGLAHGGRWAGLLAALLLLLAAPFVLLSPTVRPFTLGLCCSLLSLLLTVRLLRTPQSASQRRYLAVALALVTAAALLAWYLQFFYLALAAILLWPAWRSGATVSVTRPGRAAAGELESDGAPAGPAWSGGVAEGQGVPPPFPRLTDAPTRSPELCEASPSRLTSSAASTRRLGLAALGVGSFLALPWYVAVLPGLLLKLGRGTTVTEGTPVLPSLSTFLASLPPTVVGLGVGPLAVATFAGWTLALALGIWTCFRSRPIGPAVAQPSRRSFPPASRPPRATLPASAADPWTPDVLRRRLLLPGLLLGGGEVGLILLRWQHPDAAGRYLLGILPFAILLQVLALTTASPRLRVLALAGLTVAGVGQGAWFVRLAAIPPHAYEQDAEATFLLGHLQPGDGILFSDHGRRAQYALNQRFAVHAPTAVLQTSGDAYLADPPSAAVAALAGLLPRVQRLWYVNTEPRPGRPPLGREVLAGRAYLAAQEHAGDSDMFLFLTQPPETRRDLDLTLGNAVTLETATYTARATPGGGLSVLLRWRDEQVLGGSDSVFVHLDDASGHLVAQHDGIPAAGLRPTDAWRTGDVVDDRHGLLLPADLPAGTYHLNAGMYQVNGQRLDLPDGRNLVPLGDVVVERSSEAR